MRSAFVWLCLAAGPARAGGDSTASLSLSSEHAWSGLAGNDTVLATPPSLEVEAAVGVMRWLALETKLVWSRDAYELVAGARVTDETRFFAMRGRPQGEIELVTGTDVSERLSLELGLTRGESADVLLKATFEY